MKVSMPAPVILDTEFLPLEEVARRLGIPIKRALELQQLAEEISGLRPAAPGDQSPARKAKDTAGKNAKAPQTGKSRRRAERPEAKQAPDRGE